MLNVLPSLLLPWYREHHRDLPWRQDQEPYHIWISEIMLQQTRVEAVRGYYSRFLRRFPTIADLAEAPDEELRKLWEGLGYYTRVRNLKKAAQVMTASYGGQFPRTYKEVLALPGIGPYTAGAICSIAFQLPTPAVDGNVLRVLARLRGDETPIDLPQTQKAVRQDLEAIYPREAPGDFTQALMELGATVCGPNGAPKCEICPLHDICKSREEGTWDRIPRRSPKKPRRQEDHTVFLLECEGAFALSQRGPAGLLAGLWQFPNVPGKLTEAQALAQADEWGTHPENLILAVEREHIFTHVQWNLRCYKMTCKVRSEAFLWHTAKEIDDSLALPTAFRQFRDLLE